MSSAFRRCTLQAALLACLCVLMLPLRASASIVEKLRDDSDLSQVSQQLNSDIFLIYNFSTIFFFSLYKLYLLLSFFFFFRFNVFILVSVSISAVVVVVVTENFCFNPLRSSLLLRSLTSLLCPLCSIHLDILS